MKVELIQIPAEINDATLKQYLADCSSVVRNAQPKDNERLFQRLLKESFGDKASRVFEFLPCTLHHTDLRRPFGTFFGHFSSLKEGKYYTNARELLNQDYSWEEVIKLVDFTHYKAVKITAPYFVYGQVSTHTQITSVSHSNRYTESDLGYWMPDEIKEYWRERGYTFDHTYTAEDLQANWNNLVERTGPVKLQEYMKAKGVTRREVHARGSDMLQYRVATLGGYVNNPRAWPHFINQRLHDPHTQKETRQLAGLIAEALQWTETHS